MHVHPAHFAAVAAALAACSFSAAPGGGSFRCEAERDCPEGLTCGAGGYCEAASDAGLAPDGGAVAACGTTDSLQGSLDDADRFDWYWTEEASDGAYARAESGQLVFALPVGDGAAFAGRIAQRWYHFRDGSGVTLRVVEPPEGTAWLTLFLTFADGLEVQLTAGEGLIQVQRRSDGPWSTISSQAWVTSAASLWRVREADSQLVVEIGGEDDSFEELATLTDLPDVPVDVALYLSDDDPRDAPRRAAIADLNQGAAGRRCAASSLADDFEDGLPGLPWSTWTYRNCTFEEEGGQLRFRNMDDAYGDCGYRSRAGYDMTGDAVEIELVPPEPQSAGLNFGLRVADGYGYFLRLRAGALVQEAWVYSPSGDSRVGTHEYSPQTTRFWRLEHAAASGELRFLYSADGTDWTLLGATVGTDLDDVRLSLYCSEFAASDGVVAFDRLNLVNR